MSTNGAYGFRINNEDKITYNHWDSYFSSLGKEIFSFVRDNSNEILKEIANKIVLVDDNIYPAAEQIEELKKLDYIQDFSNSETPCSWYDILRPTQGDLNFYKTDLKFMIGDNSFLNNSLYCEYAYIINIDTLKIEIYLGRCYKESSTDGRYANTKIAKYYGVRLVTEISFEDIRSDFDKICENTEKAINEYK